MTPTSQILTTVHRLRSLTRCNAIAHWHLAPEANRRVGELDPNSWETWAIAPLNARRHIPWPAASPCWLGQRFILPFHLNGYPTEGLVLRLDVAWWAAEANLYVNGQLVQVGDLFDGFARVVLSDTVQPGEIIDVALHLVSPGHDPGALVKSMLWYEPADLQTPDPGMVSDELAIAYGYTAQFWPEELPQLAQLTHLLDWSQRQNAARFGQSLSQLRQALKPWGDRLKQRPIYWTGHAHLDLAWLWPIAETWDCAQRTFRSALDLMADFPELRFCHSSPALYAWIEDHCPELFAEIQAQVKAGRWEIAAGLWVEPELNLINGESLVRQVLYGQRYTLEKFGVLSATAWLPDTFGFCWQLPQILKQGGIEFFVTQKLRWNDTTEFPHDVFEWRSPDGTRITSIMLPPIGTRIDPVAMAYFGKDWEARTGNPVSYWLPGVGDHGGGPTRDMLSVARRWESSPLCPPLKPATAEEFCRCMAENAHLPEWQDELYLEYHRGCYTSHSDQKALNRHAEHLLAEAEILASLATLSSGAMYPKADLETAWKQVLFNQFHDILPGSSIPQVFQDANQAWQAALTRAEHIRKQALDAIAQQIDLGNPPAPGSIPMIVFNSLNWDRRERVALSLPPSFQLLSPDQWHVIDPQYRRPCKRQWLPNCTPHAPVPAAETCWVGSISVPAMGYALLWLVPEPKPQTTEGNDAPAEWILENEKLRVEIDPTTGELAMVFDKIHQRQVLSGPGNQLQCFQDQGQYWDAWNIDPNYAQHPLPGPELQSIAWVSWGPLQQRIRTTFSFGESQFQQDYCLDVDAAMVVIETQVDWQTDHVLVKAAFPLTVNAPATTYEMPAGAIQRPTLPNLDLPAWQQAKWEVPALHWADLTEETGNDSEPYGVSLLNRAKYGYDAQPNGLRLTLLRGATWPDPNCDRGLHHFTYALYPHRGSWQAARTTHHGYEFNRPLQAQVCFSTAHSLPPRHCFLSGTPENLIIMALKASEEDSHHWILRGYECHGAIAPLNLILPSGLVIDERVDGLERSTGFTPDHLEPWEILSLRLKSGRST
jgi:alpha-mannosidase